MRLWVAMVGALLGWGLVGASPAGAEDVELSNEVIGSWSIRQLEDQIDGTTRWLASADLPNRQGALVIKCDGGKYKEVYAAILFRKFMGTAETRGLTWRVDKNEPKTEQWDYDKRAAHSFNTATVWKLVTQLRDGQIFRARGTSYDFDPADVVVNIDGARAALKKVYQGCGDTQWKD